MSKLYIHTEDVHNLSAPREVVPIILDMVHPKSVLDVGCGIGTWLKAFEENGIADYLGVDGGYVNKNLLKIPLANFVAKDLRAAWSLDRKFDLVVCLEVAEHLPAEDADTLISALVAHGKTILFSAAIPAQGGQNHLNEQWPDYWQKKFEKHGFYFHDVIRDRIWNNKQVEWWYSQNIFLLRKDKAVEPLLSLVHPQCYQHNLGIKDKFGMQVLRGELGVWESFKILLRSFKRIS